MGTIGVRYKGLGGGREARIPTLAIGVTSGHMIVSGDILKDKIYIERFELRSEAAVWTRVNLALGEATERLCLNPRG